MERNGSDVRKVVRLLLFLGEQGSFGFVLELYWFRYDVCLDILIFCSRKDDTGIRKVVNHFLLPFWVALKFLSASLH